MDLNSCCCFIYYQWNPTNSHYFNLTPTFLSSPKFPHKITLLAPKSLFWRQNHPIRVRALNDDGFVLEVVPHLIDFLSNLPADFCWTRRCSCKQIVVHKDSPRGVHFRRAGPRDNVYFKPEEVRACIVTCGGLCPGLNTGGYRGSYPRNTINFVPKVVNAIHKRGGTFLCTSRGGHDTNKIVDIIQDKRINQVIDKSFGIDTAVEEAQRATNAAHVEVESEENGVGIVNLMGRYSEGTGQEYVAQNMHAVDEGDASGNRLLLDVGLWLTQKVKDHFTKVKKMEIDMKYIDPTYMIRAIPSNASENISCTLLAQSPVHGAMGGYTGFTVGPVNSRRAYIPISRVTEAQNTVKLTEDVGLTACFYKSA